jgi:hypothetical protein
VGVGGEPTKAMRDCAGEAMNKSDFEAFLKRQQSTQQDESPFDPKQQFEEWLEYIQVLYSQIEEYGVDAH